jgi:hypothetical protein
MPVSQNVISVPLYAGLAFDILQRQNEHPAPVDEIAFLSRHEAALLTEIPSRFTSTAPAYSNT